MAEPAHELSSVTRELLWKGVAHALDDAHDATWPSALAVAESIHACIRSHVSDLLLLHNARHSLQRRLPDELWCHVWAWLPHLDRTSILRVCRAWRELALATPSIWSCIFCYSAVHTDCCMCRDCVHDEERMFFEYPPGWFESPYPSGTSNISAVPKFLDLGRRGVVHLYVDIAPSRPAAFVLRLLADAFEGRALRLVSIDFRSCEHSTFRELLSRSKCWPSLRTVNLDWLPDRDPSSSAWASCHSSNALPPSIDLPKLEHLCMDNDYFLWPASNLLHLAALRFLSFHPRSVKEVTDALTVCPHLTTLRAYLGWIYGPGLIDTMAVVPELRTAVGKSLLSDVELRGFDSHEHWAVSLFRSFDALSLGYHRVSQCDLGYSIFDALRGPVHLSFQRTADRECVDATDAEGRKRQLTCAKNIVPTAPRVVKSITPERIVQLSVDVTLWAELAAQLPRGLRVSSLVFLVRTSNDIAARMPDTVDPALFPVLETVSIRSPPEHDPAVALDGIATTLRRSGLALPLPHVAVSTQFTSRGQSLPLEVALSTSVD